MRLHSETPAQKSMMHFFTESKEPKFQGRPRINLPYKLNYDLEKYSPELLMLKTLKDLQTLKVIAQDRNRWINLVEGMCVAAKAAKNF